MAEPPSSPPSASATAEDALTWYKSQYEHLESELADFRESSRELERELEKDSERLSEYLRELLDLGVEPKSATAGLVAFPSMIDGKLAYLCWKHDEPEILYWHELDAGFAGRQSLTADSVAGSDHSDDAFDA